MIVINLQTYGDFDIPGCRALMVAPNGMSKGAIKETVSSVKSMFSDSNDVERTIRVLKGLGFESVEKIDLTIGGDL